MSAALTDLRPAQVRAAADRAAEILPVLHPLAQFVAVNPAGGLQHLPFFDALEHLERSYGVRGTLSEPEFRAAHRAGRITDADLDGALSRWFGDQVVQQSVLLDDHQVAVLPLLRAAMLDPAPAPPPQRNAATLSQLHAPTVASEIDHHTAVWSAAFLGGDAAAWPMPGREADFFDAWRRLAPRDPRLPARARRLLRTIPRRSDQALADALQRLGIAPERDEDYLMAHLTALPGWAAHVRWHAEHRDGMDLVDYLAMRLAYEAALLPGTAPAWQPGGPASNEELPRGDEHARDLLHRLGFVLPEHTPLADVADLLAPLTPRTRSQIWLDAYETSYRDRLLATITAQIPRPASRPAAQLVFCIDVRSEGLRRHLEARGDYATYGFAGFFGLPLRLDTLTHGTRDLCPALVQPAYDVAEHPATAPASRRRFGRWRQLRTADDAVHAARHSAMGSFAMAEGAGIVLGPVAAARTFLPRFTARHADRIATWLLPRPEDARATLDALPVQDRVRLAVGILEGTGLGGELADLVVLVGHASSSRNNAYQAALDCGACGGNPGGWSARVAASLLNDPEVRAAAARLGTPIPESTWFLGAEHDTTVDRVDLRDLDLVPETHRQAAADLAADLRSATASLAAERCRDLPGAPSDPQPERALKHVERRAADWSEVLPELGLAGNAALAIGPRAMTAGIDLERRVFLHSYDAARDKDGTTLESILTAPLVVAHWINSQYYFSTVAPAVFGAGSKTTHNPVGHVGVLTGDGGDLRLGLPTQSLVMRTGEQHEPMRLLVIVEAPLARIEGVVAAHTGLADLIRGHWLTFVARSAPGDEWRRFDGNHWHPCPTTTAPPTIPAPTA